MPMFKQRLSSHAVRYNKDNPNETISFFHNYENAGTRGLGESIVNFHIRIENGIQYYLSAKHGQWIVVEQEECFVYTDEYFNKKYETKQG
jgi:hypothetical protein